MRDNRINFRVSSDKKTAFEQKAQKVGRKTADLLNEMIDKFLAEGDENVEITEIVARLERLEAKFMGELPA